MDEKELEAAVEGILFASGEPLHIERICFALSIERGEAERVLRRLQDYYAFERRGMRLLQMEDRWQLCSSPDHADAIRKAFEIRKPAKLSQPALEALTIIAYYQPTTRAYVDKLRGVDSAYTVGLLLERGLIETCGNLQAPGRPLLYRTTEKFLRSFHISSLDELPPLNEDDIPPQQLKIEDIAQADAPQPEPVDKPEAVEEPETAPEAETVEEAESVPETETVEEAEAVAETEPVEEAEAVAETESVDEPESVPETESVEEAEAVAETESVDEPESVPETESVEEAETVVETESVDEPESVPETESVEEAEAVAETESVEEAEAVAETESVEEAETVVETEPVKEAESAPEAELVDEPESVDKPETSFPPRELMTVSYPRLLAANPEPLRRKPSRTPYRMAGAFRTRRKRPGRARRKARRIARPRREASGDTPRPEPVDAPATLPADARPPSQDAPPLRKLSGKIVRRCLHCLLCGCWLSWPFCSF